MWNATIISVIVCHIWYIIEEIIGLCFQLVATFFIIIATFMVVAPKSFVVACHFSATFLLKMPFFPVIWWNVLITKSLSGNYSFFGEKVTVKVITTSFLGVMRNSTLFNGCVIVFIKNVSPNFKQLHETTWIMSWKTLDRKEFNFEAHIKSSKI